MMNRVCLLVLIPMLFFLIGCAEEDSVNQADKIAQEKAAILKVLNDETKAAFTRDYQSWKAKWVHEKYVSKTYMNFADSTFSESLGWDEINNFVKTYIEEHPEPDPLPDLLKDIDVRIYGNGAWVDYQQNDPGRGLKRETRLMEKEQGQWKIAGMQTIIYGPGKED